jgi:hypothetical protein
MTAGKAEPWNIGGRYFEICSCDVTCPCNFLSAPSEGFCNVAFAFEVQTGAYGSVDLRGTKVVLVIQAPDHMMKGKWKAALYIDEGATPDQRRSLETIFSGKAGGHMEKLVSFVTDFAGVKHVPIQMTFDTDKRSVEIPGILSSTIEAIKGNDGGHMILENMPLTFWLPARVTAAKQAQFKFTDAPFGMVWDWQGKHGAYSGFDWAGS